MKTSGAIRLADYRVVGDFGGVGFSVANLNFSLKREITRISSHMTAKKIRDQISLISE
jgi:hypothetical protein